MSKHRFGLLLVGVWICAGGVAHAAPNLTVTAVTNSDFGNVRVSDTATNPTATRQFRLDNTGNQTLSIFDGDITFDLADYRLNPTPTFPITLDPGGAAVTITVEFNPAQSGTRSATLTVGSTANTRTVNLTGVGTNAVIGVTDVQFNTVNDGSSSTKMIPVSNSGNAPRGILTVTRATIPPGTFFSFGTGLGCSGGTTCTFSPALTIDTNTAMVPVVCTPGSGIGTQMVNVTFDSDSDAGGDNVAQLTCTAGHPNIVVSTNSLPFNNVPVGASATQTVTIQNNGNAPLIYSVAQSPSAVAQYTIPRGCTSNCTINPGAPPATFDVTFTPTGPGLVTTQINVTSNDPDPGDSPSAIAVSGTGQAGVLATSPASHDFGPVAVGTTSTFLFTLTNTGNVAVTGITGVLSPTNTGYQFTATVPAMLGPNEQVTLPVTFAPQSTNDGGAATIRFTGSWSAGSITNGSAPATFGLNGDGQNIGFTATPSPVDFGSFRFDGQPQLTYQIKNVGEQQLSIDTATFAPDPGTVAGEVAFTFRRSGTAVNLPQSLTANQTLDVTVKLTPTSRMGHIGGRVDLHSITPGALDQHVMITGNLTAAFVDATAMLDFQAVDVDGSGVQQMITITNTSPADAPLDIVSIVPMNVNPAFTVTAPPTPMQVPVGGTQTILVKYKPTTERPPDSFDQMALVVTFRGAVNETMPDMIVLRGRGIDRHLDPATPVFQGGFEPTFAGDERTHTLTVGNSGEAMLDVTAAIESTSSAWTLVSDTSVSLGRGETHDFVIKFSPATPGADPGATLVITSNDNQHARIEYDLTGEGLFVDAHGSGGCNAGGPGRGGALAIGLAALALARRRRRRAELVVAASLVAASLIAAVPAARADDIGITVFEPTPATTGTGFQLQSPDVGADGSWVASSILSYASNPLVVDVRSSSGSPTSTPVIKRSSLLQLGAAYAFLDRFEVGAHFPLYMQSGDTVPNSTRLPVSGTARGNLMLHAKARLLRAGRLAVGTSAILVVPTASKDQYAGSDQLGARLLVLGSFAPAPRLAVSANVGAILRGTATRDNITQQSGVAWGAGASYRVLDRLWATTELFGEMTPSGRIPAGNMPATTLSQIEWLAGVSLRADPRFTIGVAAGRGVTDAAGTPDLRGVLSLSITPGGAVVGRFHPSDVTADVDSDGDGIPDAQDRCPNEPEDKDMFEDDDGCPDPDNDHDGILDAQDRCPLEPEDKDGFQDEDGCPDKDNDRDGIPDAQDRCPNEPEDKDGFEDLDGCPDPDNDHDGIPDAQDKCPNEPETINGNQDDDGCPDRGDTAIVLSPDRIETLDPIQFNGVKLARASLPLVEQIGATLRAHPEILRVRVTVHVQPTGDPDADQAKSDKRAQAVRDWLVQWGVAPARVEARGFGGSKPLVPRDQRGAARINDRIELIILERK